MHDQHAYARVIVVMPVGPTCYVYWLSVYIFKGSLCDIYIYKLEGSFVCIATFSQGLFAYTFKGSLRTYLRVLCVM